MSIFRSLVFVSLILAFISPTNILLCQDTFDWLDFERISLDEGLSQSIINVIHKDRHGFMWFGTESGLNKYDGYCFKVFKQNPFDQNSLPNNVVLSIFEDDEGFLWIGTGGGGLSKFDPATQLFVNYQHDASDSSSISSDIVPVVTGDSFGNIWAITTDGGVDKLILETGKFKRYRHRSNDPHSLSHNGIRFFYVDRSGNVWIATLSGLNKYDQEKDQFTRYQPSKKIPFSISYDEITFLYESPNEPGILWISTGEVNRLSEGGGLNRLDIASGKFTHYDLKKSALKYRSGNITGQIVEDKKGLFWIGTSQGLVSFDRENEAFAYFLPQPASLMSLQNVIVTITEDIEGVLWLTTAARNGIYRFDKRTKAFSFFTHNPNNPNSLSNARVTQILEDQSGVLWIGTNTGGLNKLDHYARKFRSYKHVRDNPNSLGGRIVRSFCEDKAGRLWVGFGGDGLDLFDPERRTISHFRSSYRTPLGLNNNNVFALLEDKFGDLWIGTIGGGLNLLEHSRKKFTHFINISNDPFSLSDNSVRAIFEDKDGALWIGTDNGGLNKFNRKNRNFTRHTHDPDNQNSISHNSVRAIVQDTTGALWLGTFGGGLNKVAKSSQTTESEKAEVFSPEELLFTHYTHNPNNPATISSNLIQSIYVDEKNILWIGTFGGGLNRFDPETEKFEHYSEQNSDLPNNVIYGVLGDDNGNIWFSSNLGISKYDPFKKEFINFDVDDGLQSKEFNGQACFKNKDGIMYFGGIDGFSVFHPDSIKNNPVVPGIAITDFKIFGESVPIGGYSPLKKHISETDEIVLKYWQNDISFEFVALHFNRPQNNKYAFILVNYDEDWREVGTKRSATYTSLDPGEYYFRVRGCNNDGVWNKKGKTVRIIITPPWWETKWAYISYFAGILVLLIVIYSLLRRYFINKGREKARVLEAELRAQAAEAQNRAIKAENERKTLELEEARKLQLSMLPKQLPQVENLDIAVHMQTAAEVGGDYYDFHVDEKNVLTVVIGDATGHGLKAGTMVSVMKSLFVANVAKNDMRSFFRDCTRTIQKLHLGNLYMALTLLKIQNSELLVSAAGMPPIYIYRSHSRQVEELTIKGMPLGAFKDFNYLDKRVKINSGDTILLLSDGLPELFNKEKEMFDYPRIKETFQEVGEKSPNKIIEHFIKIGEEWSNGGKLGDDMTFVVLKVK